MILDEATSCLTPSMEERILRAVRDHFRHSTVLTITHRVQTVLDMDRVLVLHAGRVREFDAPARLAEERGSIFHSMLSEANTKANRQ